MDELELIQKIKDRIKNNQTVKEVFDKYDIDVSEIDLVPVCFADVDVSARTNHGVIYLSRNLLDKPESIDHYFCHELVHFLQQTSGDGPTKGSTDDTYLDNKYEQEGFQNQTKYISETRSNDAAEAYTNQVLDHHDVEGKERQDKKKKLLRLNAMRAIASEQLEIKFPLADSKEELMQQYDEAIEAGPKENHSRNVIIRRVSKKEKALRLERLKQLMERLDGEPEKITRSLHTKGPDHT